MAGTILTIVLDGILVGLLVATIIYCGKLNRRVRVLQDSKGELAQLVQQFNQTTEKASNTIEELKATGKKVVEHMQVKINKANYLADDLTFMIEKGEKIASSLEGDISSARSAKPAAVTPSSVADIKQRERTSKAQGRSETRATASDAGGKKEPSLVSGGKVSSSAGGVDAMLDRIASRGSASGRNNTQSSTTGAKRPGISARIRTQAERELMDALKQQH